MQFSVYERVPEGVLRLVREFRSRVYERDSVSLTVDDVAKDYSAWHIVCRSGGEVVGCIRYIPGPGLTASVGGWAVSPDAQHTPVAVKLLFICYALGQHLGGATVTSTSTTRHGSSDILSRVGGCVQEEYYDNHYQSIMRRMTFDTRSVDPRFRKLLRFGKAAIDGREG